MSRVEFYYNSLEGATKIHGIKWMPENEVKAVLQISHGMLEHIERYDEFASYMVSRGVVVVGNDHIGHGSSVGSEEYRGYFGSKDGNSVLIEDMHTLMEITKKEYSNKPYFLLGHSMGSFLTRQFITLYGSELNGVIISGTGQQSIWLINVGVLITRLLAIIKGWKYRSKFVNFLVIGGNNNKFKPSRTKFDWLTRDDDIVDEYISDKRISFVFTLNGFYNMLKGMLIMNQQDRMKNIPRNLNMLFVSGSMDPVGKFGKDVEKALNVYKSLNVNNISIKIYEESRHEILNEINREQVYNDISMWIDKKLTK